METGASLREMTYSVGAAGAVMLDGTGSDPVACPSPYASYASFTFD
jgi:hypothetical protein